jgi:hypothetical protein
MRKFTIVLLLALAACQAPLRSAEAQDYRCVRADRVVSYCTELPPPIQHRYNLEPAPIEQDYQQRAYEYELRRLEQENNRRR